jgi:nitrogenase-associated protein
MPNENRPMAVVSFYEKPGCLNNTKQKALLREAGHTVVERNLLTEPWTKATLRPFFGELPVSAWFNRGAPAVKNGEVDPEAVDEPAALALMLGEPLLIRRPLMEANGRKVAGFDADAVDAWLGLTPRKSEADLETCPREARAERGGCP